MTQLSRPTQGMRDAWSDFSGHCGRCGEQCHRCVCDINENDSQRDPAADKFRSSNTGTLSQFETDSLDLTPTVISPQGVE